MLQIFNLADQFLVVREKRCASLEIALDQRTAYENLARLIGIDLAVVDAPLASGASTTARSMPMRRARFSYAVRWSRAISRLAHLFSRTTRN